MLALVSAVIEGVSLGHSQRKLRQVDKKGGDSGQKSVDAVDSIPLDTQPEAVVAKSDLTEDMSSDVQPVISAVGGGVSLFAFHYYIILAGIIFTTAATVERSPNHNDHYGDRLPGSAYAPGCE